MPRYTLNRVHRRIAEALAGERATAQAPAAVVMVDSVTLAIADVYADTGRTFDRNAFYRAAGYLAACNPPETACGHSLATCHTDRCFNLASCGHPANEDGECNCASWPERAATGPISRVIASQMTPR